MDDYQFFLDKKEITGTFSMQFDTKEAKDFFGIWTIPWYKRFPKLVLYLLFGNHKWAFYRWGYPYPRKVDWNIAHIPIKRDIKIEAGDVTHDLPGMYLNRMEISGRKDEPAIVVVEFSSGA